MNHKEKYTPKWNINPLKTTKECLILLHNGYTLQNATGGRVCLDECGNQIILQTHKAKRVKPYGFSNPQCWFVVAPSTGINIKVPISLMMKVQYFINAKIL